MATSAEICILTKDGKLKGVRCNYDGYLYHTGKILLENYNTKTLVTKLLSLGDMSALQPKMNKPVGHSFSKPVDGYTIFYCRDRGEDNVSAKKYDSVEDIFSNCNVDYVYVFWANNNSWYFCKPKGELESLTKDDVKDDVMAKGGGVDGGKIKTNKELSDMYSQMAINIEEEMASDKGGETSGMNYEKLAKLQKEKDKYTALSIKYDTKKKMAQGGEVDEEKIEELVEKKRRRWYSDAGGMSVMIDDMPEEDYGKVIDGFRKEAIEELSNKKMAQGGEVDTISKQEFEYAIRMSLEEVTLGQIKKVTKSGNKFDVWFSSYVTLNVINETVSVFNKTMNTNYEVVEGSYSKTSLGNKVTIQKPKNIKMAQGGKVIKNGDVQLPAGQYYVGDLCYVLHDEWDEVCDLTIDVNECINGVFTLKNGTQFALYGTAYGDGVYYDTGGREYGVDSGTLGCVLVSKVDTNNKSNDLSGGNIINFNDEFTTGYNDEDQQEIYFGMVLINTGEEEEDDSEDDYDDYDEDEYARGGGIGVKPVTYYVAYTSYFDTNKYDVEKMTKALKKLGATNIHTENDGGKSNQPEVVVFDYKGDGTDYEPTKAVQKAFDTDWIIVRVKNWRTKKMATGGEIGEYWSEINESTLNERLPYDMRDVNEDEDLISGNIWIKFKKSPLEMPDYELKRAISEDFEYFGYGNQKPAKNVSLMDGSWGSFYIDVENLTLTEIKELLLNLPEQVQERLEDKKIKGYKDLGFDTYGQTLDLRVTQSEDEEEYAMGGKLRTGKEKVKSFNDVKPGDIAVDYAGQQWEVIKTGKVKDLLKYDDSGAAEDGLNPDDNAVAVYEQGANAVFDYSQEGAVVYEDETNINDFDVEDVSFETEGDYNYEYSEFEKKLNVIRKYIDFDIVAGSSNSYETDLDFFKNDVSIANLKAEYDLDNQIYTCYLEIGEVDRNPMKINFHPFDTMGGLDIAKFEKEIKEAVEKNSTRLKSLTLSTIPGLNASKQLSILELDALYRKEPKLDDPYYPKSLIKQVGDIAYYMVMVNEDKFLLAMDTTGNYDDKWYFTSTKSTNNMSKPKETGGADIRIELTNGNVTVLHGSSGEVLLNLQDVPQGTWDKLWDFLRNKLV